MNYKLSSGTTDPGTGEIILDDPAYPTAIHDVKLVANWLRTSPVAQDACLPQKIFAMGSSAGARLCLMAGNTWGEGKGALYAPTYVSPSKIPTPIPYDSPLIELNGFVSFSAGTDFYHFGLEGACPPLTCPANSGPDIGVCDGPTGSLVNGWLPGMVPGMITGAECFVGTRWEDVDHSKASKPFNPHVAPPPVLLYLSPSTPSRRTGPSLIHVLKVLLGTGSAAPKLTRRC
ncbi:MAG: hypothetical protein ACI9EF_004014 [Pseudohongiellaceae bacterium]|jgi:hypothetical protein